MKPIEHRLSGQHATLANLTRLIDRQLDQGALTRIELRYSTQGIHALPAPTLRAAIDRLIKEHGSANRIEVSVRAHDTAFEDALGEHVLRLFPVLHSADAPARQVSLLYRLLARLLPAYFPMAGSDTPGPRSEPTGEPAVGRKEAVELLQEAISTAARHHARHEDTPVRHVLLTGRSEALHATLGPMLDRSQAETRQWLAQLLARHALRIADSLDVRYCFVPRAMGDCTMPAGDADLEVVLRTDTTRSPTPDIDDGTTLYAGTLGSETEATLYCTDTAPIWGLRLRVVGTLTGDFSEAFEMRIDTLPARIDRGVLEAAGFGRLHPDYLRLVSRQHPLTVRRGPHGGLHLDAACTPDGSPLYHQFDNLAPMKGDWGTSQERTRVIFNRPDGVVDPRSGKRIPPLVVELSLS